MANDPVRACGCGITDIRDRDGREWKLDDSGCKFAVAKAKADRLDRGMAAIRKRRDDALGTLKAHSYKDIPSAKVMAAEVDALEFALRALEAEAALAEPPSGEGGE